VTVEAFFMPFFVYIVRCSDNTLYTGQTKNILNRLDEHKKGLVHWTRSRLPVELVFFEICKTRREAMWREWEIKKEIGKSGREELIRNFDKSLIEKLRMH
jgi:putative endonuclease